MVFVSTITSMIIVLLLLLNMIFEIIILIATIPIIMKMNEEVTLHPATAGEQWGGKTMVALLDSDADVEAENENCCS